MIDADCEITANLLSATAGRLHAGADAVQAPYVISNPDASEAAALLFAGFVLFNEVRPLGQHRLGLSSGLLGTGMAFTLISSAPFAVGVFSYAENREQHKRWVLGGVRVELAPEARVRSSLRHVRGRPSPDDPLGQRPRSAREELGPEADPTGGHGWRHRRPRRGARAGAPAAIGAGGDQPRGGGSAVRRGLGSSLASPASRSLRRPVM